MDERRLIKSPSRASPSRKSSRSPLRERRVLRSPDRSPGRYITSSLSLYSCLYRHSCFRPNRRSVFARLNRRRSTDRARGRVFGNRHDTSRRRRSHSRSPIAPRRSPPRRCSRTPPPPHRSASLDRKRAATQCSTSPARERQARSRSPPKFRPRSWSMSSSGLSSSRSRSRSKSPATKARTPPCDTNPQDNTPDSRGSTPRDYSPYNRAGDREVIDARDYAEKPPTKPRCRDYDEKGFCMRGDLCPYDHGNDAVVVDDVRLNNVLQLNQPPTVPNPRLPAPMPPTSVFSQLVGRGGSITSRMLLPRGPVPAPPPAIGGPLAGLPINLSQPPPSHPARKSM